MPSRCAASGATIVVEATMRARPVFRGAFMRAIVMVLVVAVWIGLAVVAIPRITSYLTSDAEQSAGGGPAGQGAGGAPGSGSATPSGSGAPGSGGGADGGSADGGGADGAGADGGGADGSAGGDGAGAAAGERLRGLVTGSEPGGVTVILAPTSLGEAAAAGAQPAAGVTDEATASGLRAAIGAIGKIPSSAVRLVQSEDPPTVTTDTATDGTFSMAGIRAPGFYLLTFARAGYQTQRFVVNAATLADADPLEVALVAGQGELSGQVNRPNGASRRSRRDDHRRHRVAADLERVRRAATGRPGPGTSAGCPRRARTWSRWPPRSTAPRRRW